MAEHPSLEDIALFVYGRLPDPSVIERHIVQCADCAAEVTLGREMRYMESLGLIPAPGAAREPTLRQSPERARRPATNPPSSDKGTVFGALAGGLGLAGLLDWLTHSTPLPALGEQDSPETETDHPSHPAHQEHHDSLVHHAQPEHHEDSENSAHLPVTHDDESASHDKEDHSSSSHGLDEFLDSARETLNAERADHDDAGHFGDAAGHHWSDSSAEPDDGGSLHMDHEHQESDDGIGEDQDFADSHEEDHTDASNHHGNDHHDDPDDYGLTDL